MSEDTQTVIERARGEAEREWSPTDGWQVAPRIWMNGVAFAATITPEQVEAAARGMYLADRKDTLPEGFPERQWDNGPGLGTIRDDYVRRARAAARAMGFEVPGVSDSSDPSDPSDLEYWTIRASASGYDGTYDDDDRRDFFLAWLAVEKAKWQAEERERIAGAIRAGCASPPTHVLTPSQQAAWKIGMARAHAIARGKGSDDER